MHLLNLVLCGGSCPTGQSECPNSSIRPKGQSDGVLIRVVLSVVQDKVLVSSGPHNEGVQVTNDGATILKSIGVDNPAAKVLVG